MRSEGIAKTGSRCVKYQIRILKIIKLLFKHWKQQDSSFNTDMKKLGNFNPILTTRKIPKLRINKFSWIHQRKEITDQTDTLHLGRLENSENHRESLPGGQVPGTISWYKHIEGNFDKLLEIGCETELGVWISWSIRS